MSYDDLKEMLMKKIGQELFNYKQNLIKNYTPEEIIKEAYEINFKEQIKDIINSSMIGIQAIKVLLKTDNVIGKLYDYWIHSDGSIWRLLEDKINEKIEEMTTEDDKQKRQEKVR